MSRNNINSKKIFLAVSPLSIAKGPYKGTEFIQNIYNFTKKNIIKVYNKNKNIQKTYIKIKPLIIKIFI